MQKEMTGSIGVAQLIRAIQSELEKAQEQREREGRTSLFKVKSMDIEVQFILSSETSVRGGFDIKVLSAGADEKIADQVVHKLVLHLDSSVEDFGDVLGAYPREETR